MKITLRNSKAALLIPALLGGFLSISQNEPLIFSVKDIFNLSGIGNVVTGKVESGTIQTGAVLEARGRGEKVYTVTVGKIFLNNKEVVSAAKDDQASFQVKGLNNGDLRMGMVIATPGMLETVKFVTAAIRLLAIGESGLSGPLKDGATVQLILHDHLVFATVVLKEGMVAREGSEASIGLKFSIPVAARLKDRITLQQNGKNIGEGILTAFPKD